MWTFRHILRAILKWGGLGSLLFSIAVFFLSRYIGLSFAPTRFESVCIAGGEWGLTFRVKLKPEYGGMAPGLAMFDAWRINPPEWVWRFDASWAPRAQCT